LDFRHGGGTLRGSALGTCSLRRGALRHDGLLLRGGGKGRNRLAARHHFVGDVAENETGEQTDEEDEEMISSHDG
jgi:hypothetical protein